MGYSPQCCKESDTTEATYRQAEILVKMKPYCITVGPEFSGCVLPIRPKGETLREESHVQTEQRSAKELRVIHPPETGRSKEGTSHEPAEGARPCQQPDFGLTASRERRRANVSHPVHALQLPQEMKTVGLCVCVCVS